MTTRPTPEPPSPFAPRRFPARIFHTRSAGSGNPARRRPGRSLCTRLLTVVALAVHFSHKAEEAVDPAYLKVVTERAGKIVATLGIADTNAAERVSGLIAQQYGDLSQIHERRDSRIAAAQAEAGAAADRAARAVAAARQEADAAIYRLHAAFLARLSVELTPEQVEGVKDGITYGVATNTYQVYLKMCPDLSDAQKRQVKAWLLEARELAMDQGSAKEKHGVFGKYKGKINNYLAAAGYNLKEAEQNLRR